MDGTNLITGSRAHFGRGGGVDFVKPIGKPLQNPTSQALGVCETNSFEEFESVRARASPGGRERKG